MILAQKNQDPQYVVFKNSRPRRIGGLNFFRKSDILFCIRLHIHKRQSLKSLISRAFLLFIIE
ncbi:MAG: hypothetical protein JWM44_2544 [Bacilli bacterium]|nr:hypothetical protein [Bacilli bacterium]